MLEIPPLSPVYPAIKLGKLKKDEPRSEPRQRKKKPALAEPENAPVQHIDEIV